MDEYSLLKQQFDLLASQKDLLEIEAEALHSDLTSPGLNGEPPAGITGNLVDAEGFPRGDINIYDVKAKRARLRVINTGTPAFSILFLSTQKCVSRSRT